MRTPENYYNIADVMTLTGYKYTKSQKIIKSLNDELKAKGYIIIPGIVPKIYYRQRFGLDGVDIGVSERRKA